MSRKDKKMAMTFNTIDGINPSSVSVTQHALGGQILGTVNGLTYTRVAKADGGYDYYRVDSTGRDVRLISSDDAARELGVDLNQEAGDYSGGSSSGGSTYQGLSAQEISAAIAKHNQNLKEIDRAYQEGLLTFQQKQQAIDQSREDIKKSRDEGLSSNSAYFSAVSPDAFQSQIGNYNTKVLDAYQQGSNTIENDQKAINFARQNFEDRTNEARAGENTFNQATGLYTQPYTFNSPVAQAPALTNVNTNLPSSYAARLPQAPWSPNSGGMSVQQTSKNRSELDKYLYN